MCVVAATRASYNSAFFSLPETSTSSQLLSRFNALVDVNFSLLEELCPNLTNVDLKDNPLDCTGFAHKRVIKIIMITDREITASVQ